MCWSTGDGRRQQYKSNATAVPGLGSLGERSRRKLREGPSRRSKTLREGVTGGVRACGVHAMQRRRRRRSYWLCPVLSLVYVRTSLARCERTTGIAAVANSSFISSSSPTTPFAASPRLSRTAFPWRHMRCRTYTIRYAPVSLYDRPRESWLQKWHSCMYATVFRRLAPDAM